MLRYSLMPATVNSALSKYKINTNDYDEVRVKTLLLTNAVVCKDGSR